MPTPWTYTTLAQALVDWMVLDGQTAAGGFSTATPQTIANVNVAIQNAEDRISKEIDLPAWRKTSVGTNLATGVNTYTLPADFLSMYAFSITYYDSASNASYILPLLERDPGFIREAFGSIMQVDWQAPRYYALNGVSGTANTILVGGTPDQNYALTIDYQASVTSIVTATTTWLGTYAPSCLFNCALQNLYAYLKGETDVWTNIAQMAQNDLEGLTVLGSGRQRKDTFFEPNTRVPV
jgi:hypothetical protein